MAKQDKGRTFPALLHALMGCAGRAAVNSCHRYGTAGVPPHENGQMEETVLACAPHVIWRADALTKALSNGVLASRDAGFGGGGCGSRCGCDCEGYPWGLGRAGADAGCCVVVDANAIVVTHTTFVIAVFS